MYDMYIDTTIYSNALVLHKCNNVSAAIAKNVELFL